MVSCISRHNRISKVLLQAQSEGRDDGLDSALERHGSVMVSTSAWHAAGRRFESWTRHVSLLGVKSWLSTLEIVYLRVFFGGDTKNRRSLLSGVYVKGK